MSVKVVEVHVHPEGGFTVRGTLERGHVPDVLRGVADEIEASGEGDAWT